MQALGANSVYAVHIDNGFMRKNESKQVADSLESMGLKLTGKVYHAFDRFPRFSIRWVSPKTLQLNYRARFEKNLI